MIRIINGWNVEKYKRNYHTVTTSLTLEQGERLTKIAEAMDRSQSYCLRRALLAWIDAQENA